MSVPYIAISNTANYYIWYIFILGIVSYNEYEDDLLIASKSTLDSQFAQWFREMLYEKISAGHKMPFQ